METILLNNDKLSFLIEKCKKHFEDKSNQIDVSDILYSFFNDGCMLNDWDEGENNDPFWDKKNDCHSAVSFINEMVKYLKNGKS